MVKYKHQQDSMNKNRIYILSLNAESIICAMSFVAATADADAAAYFNPITLHLDMNHLP